MIKIAHDAGAVLQREGSETEAWLQLPPGSFATHIDEIVATQAAELDYRLKASTHIPTHPAASTQPEADEPVA